MDKWDNNLLVDFLISPHYRARRHLLMQIFLIICTLDVFMDPLNPEIHLTANRLYSCIGYYIVLSSAIYINLYVLTPCFLIREKLIPYLVALLALILIVISLVVLSQLLFYNLSSETIEGLPVWFNILASILNLGRLRGGISTLVLLKSWIITNQRIDELQSNTLHSELRYLKNQINPHFLFNMLNNANVLIRKNPEEASRVLYKLEALLQYQISDSSKEEVPLYSEIRSLNDFLNLEKIRRDRFEYTLAKEGDIDKVHFPPLLFIPFVENAVKYSFDGEYPSQVTIRFSVWNNRLLFQCENTLPQTPVEKGKMGGIGLSNIRRRLELLYPEKYKLETRETENKYRVILQINL
ncbi:MAG: histidine kinase [Bacteroides sp.]|nr:histidine kinase [Bacteroides sp.]